MTRQLAVLVRSGVPVVEALRALSDESPGRMQTMLVDIRERVMEGGTLSRALDSHPDIFPDFYRHMVEASEEGGALDATLERLAGFLEAQTRVREKVRTAMIYPTVMAAVAFAVMLLLFTFVVPRIVSIFENNEAILPLATVLLIWMSDVFINYWWLLIGGLVAMTYTARRLIPRYRARMDRTMMRILPSLFLSRFARTLGFLLEGGLPVLRAMELAGRASGNRWVEDVATGAALKVSEGSTLSAALAGLPPVMRELISTGEQSGRLPEVLDSAADSYEAEFDRLMQRGLAYLGPGMVLLMASVVAFIVFSVLLPMFRMNQLIQ